MSKLSALISAGMSSNEGDIGDVLRDLFTMTFTEAGQEAVVVALSVSGPVFVSSSHFHFYFQMDFPFWLTTR